MSCKHCNLPCSKPYWWSPSQIKFCWSQVTFLLANYGTLKATKWPQKPSGYIDTHEDVQQSYKEGGQGSDGGDWKPMKQRVDVTNTFDRLD